MKKSVLALAMIVTGALGAAAPASAAVIEQINPSASSSATWAASEVGWFYTPTVSYNLTGLGTKFGSSDGRTVGAFVYSGSPGALTLLGSSSLTPVGNAFAQAAFSPLSLSAGTTYFVAFTNVAGLATNVTDDAGATNLAGGLRYSFGSGAFELGPETGFTAQPMLQFSGNSAVPEPATWAMLITGFGLAGAAMRRRRATLAFA